MGVGVRYTAGSARGLGSSTLREAKVVPPSPCSPGLCSAPHPSSLETTSHD